MKKISLINIVLLICSLDSFCWGSSQSSVLSQLRTLNSTSIKKLTGEWVENGGLEIITGGPSASNTESRWGHTSIRFFMSGDTSIQDIVAEAVALNDSSDSTLGLIYKGLSGGYPAVLNFKTVGDQIRYYYYQELRGYKRTIIPTNRHMRAKLVETLRRVNAASSPEDQYFFLSNNCTSYIAKLLKQADFNQLPLPYPFVPKQANIHYRRSYLSPWPEMTGISIEFLKDLEANIEKRQSFSNLPTLNLQQLLVFSGLSLGENLLAVAEELSKRTDKATTEEVYGLQALPTPLYQRTTKINKSFNSTLSKMFTTKEIEHTNLYNRTAWHTTYGHQYCTNHRAQCDYFREGMQILFSLD